MFSFAETHNIGNTLRDAIESFKPRRTSSIAKSPLSKYFSIKSSEPAAAFSTNARRSCSAFSFSSAGMSKISGLPPPAGYLYIFCIIKSMKQLNPGP